MKEDVLLINGKRYVHTPEVKKEKPVRAQFFVHRWKSTGQLEVFERKEMYHYNLEDFFHVKEIRENEFIISEDILHNILMRNFPCSGKDIFKILKEELFKKDGV